MGLVVSRREYKVMLDHRLFADDQSAVEVFGHEAHRCAKRLKGIEWDGEFKPDKRRTIAFLDTKDNTIRLNRLLLRQRVDLKKDEAEYTLKCRSPDRYVAVGAKVEAGEGFEDDVKLEEDIGSPFVVRFSHSNTIAGPLDAPEVLGEAARIFPALGRLKRDGDICSEKLRLRCVNAIRVFERVLKGPLLRFDDTEAEVGLILWSDGDKGRPLVAEFSFRYAHPDEDYSPKAARKALEFFEEIQRLDWCLPGASTKTQFAYGE